MATSSDEYHQPYFTPSEQRATHCATSAFGDVWTARAWPKADIVATTAQICFGPSSIITGCPLYAKKRTSESRTVMSVLGQ